MQWPWRAPPQWQGVVFGEALQRLDPEDAQAIGRHLVQPVGMQAAERFVRVHQGQTQCIGNVLLIEGEIDAALIALPDTARTLVKMHEQHCNALHGASPADGKQVLVHDQLFVCAEPCEVIGEPGKSPIQIPKLIARKDAQPHRCKGFDPMGHLSGQFGLKADEIPRQEKTEDLPAPIRKTSVAKCPTCAQGEQQL